MSAQATPSSDFQSLCVRVDGRADAERVLAEALEAGAVGAEERESERGITLILYAPRERTRAVHAACAALGALALGEPADCEPVDWSEAWKAGLGAVEISPRLRIRPPFETSPPTAGPRAGQRELVIEPGQAFGTGGHESTRLALGWLDALAPRLPGARVLDAGVGSGVLGLAALALGAHWALGFDLDPLAAPAARANAARNGLAARLALFTGPVRALAPGARFDGGVANLLRRELEPLLPELVSHLQSEAWLVISGLLASERDAIVERCRGLGLRPDGERGERDASGAEWIGLLMRRGPPRAAPRAAR